MQINCPYCRCRIKAQVAGEVQLHDPEDIAPQKTVLLKCPDCGNALVGQAYLSQIGPTDYDWDNLTRVWPDTEDAIHWKIPSSVRDSLNEAQKCLHIGAFSASAVMSGKAIEAMCVNLLKEPARNLAEGLRTLRDARIIDDKLFLWGNSLREERNLGAHANTKSVNARDATDVLDFALAICQYVFVLSDQYEEYMKRKERAKKLTE